MKKVDHNSNLVTVIESVPYSIIAENLDSKVKDGFYSNLAEIKRFYDIYEKGAKFTSEGSGGDYIPSELPYKTIAAIIDKETRFMFSNPLSMTLNNDVSDSVLKTILDKNKFNSNLLKAAKDCFISGRIAILVNFDPTAGITINFLKAYDFIYTHENNELIYFVCFWKEVIGETKNKEVWRKKEYTKNENGVFLTEKLIDGYGKELEIIIDNGEIDLENIPAVVVFNETLLGDTFGRSEIDILEDYESYKSFLNNADIDAVRKGMNPTRYTQDADQNSTKNLSISPGSYWDLKSDMSSLESGASVKTGILEPQLSYNVALEKTINRIDTAMHDQVGVPQIDIKTMHGIFSSMKALKAIYWDLEVRSNEKWLEWQDDLLKIFNTIIEGAANYPESLKVFTKDKFAKINDIIIEKRYALPEDQEADRIADETAVLNNVMSRKRFIKKWFNLTDEQAEEELKQIKQENDMLDNSMSVPTERTIDNITEE